MPVTDEQIEAAAKALVTLFEQALSSNEVESRNIVRVVFQSIGWATNDKRFDRSILALEAAYWVVSDPSDITPRQLARIALEAAERVPEAGPV